ncbi:MAG TPA: hypothetical protein VFS00_17445 [Polyangiaceae bacterium]|nr:hypothetical protein [Polyangiaceae bacterium]
MPGAAHEILILALREQPSLLATLLERLTGRPAPGPLTVADSALRFADVKEVRPDLVLEAPGLPWAALEVQHEVDATKQRRWPLAASVLLDEHGAMGELLVLTHRRRVARWAAEQIVWQGPRGTRLALYPLVLWVDLDAAEGLLREGEPALALVAAWALQGKGGPRSKALPVRAVERTAALPEPVRTRQGRAIMQLFGKPLRDHLHAMLLKDLEKVPQSKSFKKFLRAIEGPAEARGKAKGEAKGKAEGKAEGKVEGRAEGEARALLKYLEQRGVALTAERRQRIEGCTDLAQLDRWLERAFAAPNRERLVEAVFGEGG